MNTDELDAIRARVDAATPGEWEVAGIAGYMNLCTFRVAVPECGHIAQFLTNEDAEFIAHAPADIRALLIEVDRLTAQVAVDARIISEQAWQIEALVCELATAQERMIGTARVLSTIHAVPDVNPQAGEGE